MNENRLGTREVTVIIAAAVTMLVGCGLLIASVVIPPPGEIDSSVLIAFGEISTFSGALFGVKVTKNGIQK